MMRATIRRILRQLRHDLRCGGRGALARLLACALAFSVSSFFLVYDVTVQSRAGVIDFTTPQLTAGDFWAGLFGGYPEFRPGLDQSWDPPVGWLLLVSMGAYVTLGYPSEELSGLGRHTLVLSGERWAWWSSKCLWVVLQSAAYVAVALLACAAFSLACGGDASLRLSTKIVEVTHMRPTYAGVSSVDLSRAIPCAWLSLGALGIIQMTCALLLGQTPAFLLTLATLFLSSFVLSPALIGNYLMACRLLDVSPGGVEVPLGIFACLAVSLFVSVLGGALFSRTDLPGERQP